MKERPLLIFVTKRLTQQFTKEKIEKQVVS
jgi:hypothetical protein